MRPRYWFRPEGGQSLLEFAIVLPVVMMIILGTLDIGRAIYDYNAMYNGANEGARWLAGHPTQTDPLAYETAPYTNTVAAINAELGPLVGPLIYTTDATSNVTIVVDGNATVPAYVTVTLVYSFTPLTGILLGGKTIPLQVQTKLLLH